MAAMLLVLLLPLPPLADAAPPAILTAVAPIAPIALVDRRVFEPAEVRAGTGRAVEFLLRAQKPDGAWGGPQNAVYTFTGDVWSNPETHRAWTVATTGLCVEALLRGESSTAELESARRGVEYLLANAAVGRPNEWDTMNNWAYIYGLQGLAAAYADEGLRDWPRRAEIEPLAAQLVRKLEFHQSLNGGWGYLEFDGPRTAQPQWATSFMTAAGVIAMQDAAAAGLAHDDDMLRRALSAVRQCRLPNGAFTYSVPAIADPRHSEWIDQVKGSLSRIQVCNLALKRGGDPISAEQLRTGLRQFFAHHRFLDIARNRPIPHETYYFNSGYFYFFGHYYAARVIELLPAGQRDEWWRRLQFETLKSQQADGSMWDYDMHAYGKAYGTGYALSLLKASQAAVP